MLRSRPDLFHGGRLRVRTFTDTLDRGAWNVRALGKFVLAPPFAVDNGVHFFGCGHGGEGMQSVAPMQLTVRHKDLEALRASNYVCRVKTKQQHAMKFLTESQAEALAAKIKMAPLTEEQEYAIAKHFAERRPSSVACFLIGNCKSIKTEYRRFRKEEIASMRFDAWKEAAGARWDNQHCRFVIFSSAA